MDKKYKQVKVYVFDEMQVKNFHINVYTLLYEKDSERKSSADMTFNTLYEVPNPKGVFIIIKSNAELKTPIISNELRTNNDMIN